MNPTQEPQKKYIVTYSGFYFTMELYCTPKVNTLQLNTVRNSPNTRTRPTRTVSEHSRQSYTILPTGTLWQSSSTHSNSCSQKASKHKSGQSIVGLSVHLHTTTAPRNIINLSFTSSDDRMSSLERPSNPTDLQTRLTSTSVLEQFSNHTEPMSVEVRRQQSRYYGTQLQLVYIVAWQLKVRSSIIVAYLTN
jgi:hypothetical protein